MTLPLVLLPGSGCSADLWSDLRLRGEVVHGRLDRPTLDGCVEHLLATLPPRFALAGLSLGGIVAMALTRRAPERVAALCLMATNARPPTDAQRAAWAAQRDALAGGASARSLQEALLPVLTARRAADERVLAMADAVGEREWDAQLQLQASRVDERPGLRDVRVPTLVIAGERDGICPVANHVEIAATVPGAALHVVPGAGHLLPLDAPAAVRALLDQVEVTVSAL
jgi:pimeloyl-ACP methyl ester carboxylesterase